MSTEVEPVRPRPRPPVPSSQVRIFLTADVRRYARFTRERGDEAAARLATHVAAAPAWRQIAGCVRMC